MTFTRRSFSQLAAGAAVGSLAAPQLVRADSKPRVVVVGGGPGGATAAKYIARDSQGAIDVTLIEANPQHTTCFFSNLYLGDFVSFDDITHSYDSLRDNYGVNVVQGYAAAIEEGAVVMADGTRIPYDRAVVSPGIDFKFDIVDGLDAEIAATKIPHAYKAGPQTQLLYDQLRAMDDGGTVIIATPPNPFRCPPGPYERASMIANYLTKNKPSSKIVILDPKDKHSKQALFQEAWARFYPGMIEWVPGEFTGHGFESVDADSLSVTTNEGETFTANVLNFIPAQTAGAVVMNSGLTGDGEWAPVAPDTLESTIMPNVHVLGDACANGAMPKSGFSANSQAKAVAMAVRAALTDSRAFPPRFRNTCWSLVSDDNSIKVGANYKAGESQIEKTDGFISSTGEDDETREATAVEASGWYDGITQDIFY